MNDNLSIYDFLTEDSLKSAYVKKPYALASALKSNLPDTELVLNSFKALDLIMAKYNECSPDKQVIKIRNWELKTTLGVKKLSNANFQAYMEPLLHDISYSEYNEKNSRIETTSILLFSKTSRPANNPEDEDSPDYDIWLVPSRDFQELIRNHKQYLGYNLSLIRGIKNKRAYILLMYIYANKYRHSWDVTFDELKERLDFLNYNYQNKEISRIIKNCFLEINEQTSLNVSFSSNKKNGITTYHITVEEPVEETLTIKVLNDGELKVILPIYREKDFSRLSDQDIGQIDGLIQTYVPYFSCEERAAYLNHFYKRTKKKPNNILGYYKSCFFIEEFYKGYKSLLEEYDSTKITELIALSCRIQMLLNEDLKNPSELEIIFKAYSSGYTLTNFEIYEYAFQKANELKNKSNDSKHVYKIYLNDIERFLDIWISNGIKTVDEAREFEQNQKIRNRNKKTMGNQYNPMKTGKEAGISLDEEDLKDKEIKSSDNSSDDSNENDDPVLSLFKDDDD